MLPSKTTRSGLPATGAAGVKGLALGHISGGNEAEAPHPLPIDVKTAAANSVYITLIILILLTEEEGSRW